MYFAETFVDIVVKAVKILYKLIIPTKALVEYGLIRRCRMPRGELLCGNLAGLRRD